MVVGGMGEGVQVLLLGFYFKYYITTRHNFGQKIKFYHFWWLTPENSKNCFLPKDGEKSGTGWILRKRVKSKALISNFHVILQAKL